MIRFERDDAGYVAWLATHPDGYVLNTYMNVTSDYLILHEARCWTVNHPLSPNRSWTLAYGKTCADGRADLETWALTVGGKPAQPCGHCLGGGSRSTAPTPSRSALRPRGQLVGGRAVEMAGEPVTIRISPMPVVSPAAPALVIEGAQWLSETFFRQDPSAIGPTSFDAWIRETQLDPERRDTIIDEDVTAVNTTMAARTSHETWATVRSATDWSWLTNLGVDWDLVEMPDVAWKQEDVPARLHAAFAAVRRPGLHVAVITKVLHIKRPRLIPVLDSLVLAQIGARITDDVGTWVRAIEHLRAVGLENRWGLVAIREHLEHHGIRDRSLVRILDSLMWTAAPGAGLFGHLDQWERVLRPRAK